ncbi:MAG: DUF2341 domain-containing protein [Candidatus Doudnabacteria bacterium]|nr:DUF2341 domain-containing protein [Candidatus Doudnabacteria bacterium]
MKKNSVLKNQAGVTLMLSVLVLSAILAIAFSLATVTFVEIRSSGDLIRTEPAYYSAESVSEEALFKIKRNLSDQQLAYNSSLNNVDLSSETTFLSTPIFQAKIGKTTNSFTGTTNRYPLFDTSCPAPLSGSSTPAHCVSGGSGYARLKLTYLDTGNNTDQMRAYLCQFDPRKSVDPTGSDPSAYRTLPCSDPSDTTSGYWLVYNDSLSTNNTREGGVNGGNWPSLDPYQQQELILYNSGGGADIYAQVETYDGNGLPKGLPLVGSTAVDISASNSGVVRKIRTVIPASASSGGSVAGFAHYRTITIPAQSTNSADLSSFPVLISTTLNSLKTTSNGGSVTNANGYDIVFYSNSSLSSKLDYQVESYNSATGELNAWVRVPVVSRSAPTLIYMAYGNSGIASSQESVTSVWDSNYKAVLHMADSTSNTDIQDSTSNGNLAANVANTNGKSIAGIIKNALSYDGSTDYSSFGSSNTLNFAANEPFTFSAWFKTTNSYGAIISFRNSAQDGAVMDLVVGHTGAADNGGRLAVLVRRDNGGGGFCQIFGNLVNDNNWHYAVAKRNSSGTVQLYLDGSSQGTCSGSETSGAITTNLRNIAFERRWVQDGYLSQSTQALEASLDEIRISNIDRSSDWVATEHRNQSSPGAFYTVGSEQ